MSSSSAPPHRPSLAVTFVDVERADMERTGSNIDLEKFNSAAPTLNNTPSGSRNPSPDRKKVSSRSPTPSPKQVDIEAMDSKERINTISRYTNDELDIAWMGGVIITCFFTSGLIDAVAFNSWNCFVGMQTGSSSLVATIQAVLSDSQETQYSLPLVLVACQHKLTNSNSSSRSSPSDHSAWAQSFSTSCIDFPQACTINPIPANVQYSSFPSLSKHYSSSLRQPSSQ